MKKIMALLLFLVFCSTIFSQANEKKSFGISFSGFVKSEMFFDSRQTASVREGHFLLYPQPEVTGLGDEDINATPSLNMLSIQTRLSGNITAPDAFGAKISGKLEGAFFGHSNGDINGFRLRHAFVKLSWDKTTLILGQYWHPMFITEVFPGVVSFNTGVPFQPFARNPQIRLINQFDNIFLTFTAASQRDFASAGPKGSSSEYLRNSSIPILDFNLKYKKKNIVAGAGFNFKTIKPFNEYQSYKVDDKVSSYSAMAFAKIVSDDLTIKLEGVYGTNLYDVLMLGGYAINNYGTTGNIDYTNVKTMSAWTDITFGKKLLFGLFAGYSKNLGTEDENIGEYYSRGSNIEYVFRLSPRIQYQIEKVRFAGEIEYTTAAYGTRNIMGEVENSDTVSNLRILVAAYLFF